MDIFKTFLYIALIVFSECKVVELGNKDENRQSMVEIVQQLVRETADLKKDVRALHVDNQKLKTDNEKLKTEADQLKTDNEKLKTEMALLTRNGHLQYSVADQQWQSLHTSAAAACRGSTALGGHGPWANAAFPRTKGHNCEEVCAGTKSYTECDASLSIVGYMGRIKKPNTYAAWYYNYGCKGVGYAVDEIISSDVDVFNGNHYFGFCCCRHGPLYL